jgi:ligand-binding sensor domain-containing protein
MIVATPAGLSFVEAGGVSSLYAFQGLVNNHVYTLAQAGSTLYAGTLGGVTAIRGGLVQASFTTANTRLRQNWITASAVFDGKLYLGTYGSGVIGFDDRGGSVETFRSFAGQRCEINQNAMLATNRALYAGTSGQGLAILRRGEERWQMVEDGLPSMNVTALAERGGELLIGTDNGLVRVAEKDLVVE